MTLPPIIPLILLILGALAVGASDLARLRRPSLVMVIASLLALLAGVAVRADAPLTQIVSNWQPVSVFTVPISFRVDHTAWLIGGGLLLACTATALTWLAYPGQGRPAPRALSMLLVASALAGVYASNLLTLTVAWGLLDVVFIAALLVHSGPQIGRRAATAIVLNTSSTICVWIATLLIENGHDSLYWHLVSLPSEPRMWLAAAGVLRLGLYPLHQWLPIELCEKPDRSVLLFTVPPTVGLALFARLAMTNNLPPAGESIVPLLGLVSAVVGAVLAWRSHCPRAGLPFIALGLAGLAVLNVDSLSTPGTLIAVTLNWLFIMISLLIARGFQQRAPWWSVGAIIAGLSIAGVPGTLGFAARYAMITNLARSGEWAMLTGGLLAEGLLLAAAVRAIFAPAFNACDDRPIGRGGHSLYGLALIAAAAPLIGLALTPNLIPAALSLSNMLGRLSPITSLAWLMPIIAGAFIVWSDRRPAAAAVDAAAEAPLWARAVRLDWVNALFSQVVQRLIGLLRSLAGVIEGEGGLIWVMIIVIVGVVLTSGALK
jgi:NADH:ubiquinone oxidoreductase subunit 2 (subunit N)